MTEAWNHGLDSGESLRKMALLAKEDGRPYLILFRLVKYYYLSRSIRKIAQFPRRRFPTNVALVRSTCLTGLCGPEGLSHHGRQAGRNTIFQYSLSLSPLSLSLSLSLSLAVRHTR